MMTENHKTANCNRNANEVTSEQLLSRAKSDKVQRVQKAMLDIMEGIKIQYS